MEQPPSHPDPRHAHGSYTLAVSRAAATGENRPPITESHPNTPPRDAPHPQDGPAPAESGNGAEEHSSALMRTGRRRDVPRAQPLVPNPIARYSFSSALVGSLANTCDMYRCPCE